MSEKTLRIYLKNVIKEEYFRREIADDADKISFPIFKKIKSLFFGDNIDEVVDSWLESKETYYDITFEDEFRDEVKDFSSKVYKKAIERTKGNKEKATKMLKRTLDVKYSKKLKQLETSYLRDFEDE